MYSVGLQIGRKRLLILDGYGSRYTKPYIKYCDDHNIILFGLPPHSTHILQPLDVVVFQPLKHYYNKAIDCIVRDGCLHITKIEFFMIIQDVWLKSFKKTTILSSFEKTGIHPWNPQLVLQKIYERVVLAHPVTPEPQSSPCLYRTPTTYKQINKVAYQIESQIKDLEDDELKPYIKANILRFINGALAQGAELIQTMSDLKRTKLAEEQAYRRRLNKNRQLQSGGILTVADSREITKKLEEDELTKARRVVEKAEQQMRERRKQLPFEVAKVARKWRADGRLVNVFVKWGGESENAGLLYVIDDATKKGRWLKRA